jgi:hypothetical protein
MRRCPLVAFAHNRTSADAAAVAAAEERCCLGLADLLRMPTGLVDAQGDLGGDLVEMKLHSFGVAGWQHEGCAGPALRAHCAEQIGRLGALIVAGART